MDVTIALGGDTMLGRGVGDELRRGRPEAVWAPEVRAVLGEADIAIVNLECCISERGAPWRPDVKPFHFRAPPAAVEALAAANVGAVWLANNHALDYGVDALEDTFGHLDRAGIAWAGAGRDEQDARTGRELVVAGRRIGLVGVADHPSDFAAGSSVPGTAWAPLQPDGQPPAWLLEEIGRLGRRCDAVIVGPHWGPNMRCDPLPHHPALAASLIDAGAAVVAGHSAHVFQAIEIVDGRPVCYDLGDLLDDYAVDPSLRNDLGILALWRPGAWLDLVPLRLDLARTSLATGDDLRWVVTRLIEACAARGTFVRREGERLRIDLTGPSAGRAASV